MIQFPARSRHFVVAIAAALAAIVCAPGSAQVPAQTQPALTKMAQPYADDLRKAGIKSVMVYGNGARVRTATRFGEVYLRYPKGLSPTDFALYVGAQDVEVDSDSFTAGSSSQYEAAMKAILPEAIRLTTSNNTREMEQRMGGR